MSKPRAESGGVGRHIYLRGGGDLAGADGPDGLIGNDDVTVDASWVIYRTLYRALRATYVQSEISLAAAAN